MIIGISGFCFFWPKLAVSWLKNVFQKMGCWNPYFYRVFLGARFLAKLSKREILDTHQKKKKLTDNWKALSLWYFCVFFLFVFSFFFVLFPFSFIFCFFCVFFGGFKGQVRWPEGPPHLALNPPYFFLFLFGFWFFVLCFVFLEGLRVRWGGPKGHLTWP